MDGDTSASSTTLADADRVVVNDAGTMKQVALTDFETYFESALDTLSNVTTVGALNSGSITSGFGAIDVGSSNLTATGTISLGATSFNDNAITNVGDIALDSISADATDINVAVSDNSATAFTIKQGSDAYLIVDTGNSSESVSIGTGISGTAITLGHGTSEVTVGDNLTVTGNLTVSGTTTTVNSTTVNLNDHNIVLDSGNSTSAVINGAGITIEGGSGDDATFTYNTTGPQFELKLGSSFEDLQTAKLTATELDISGDVDVDGTTNLDNTDIDGTLNVQGETTLQTHLNMGDGDIIKLGADADLQIQHNGTNSIIRDNGTGALDLQVSNFAIVNLASDEFLAKGTQDGAFELYNDGTKRIETTSSGVTVTGVVVATSLDISGDADIDGTLETDALSINSTSVTSTGAELNLVDGSSAGTIVNSKAVIYGSSGEVNATTLQIAGASITSTAAELNIMDGDTSASATTLADADRLVTNDSGTMKQVALTDVKTYLTSAGFTTDDPTALAIALG
jgi:hypothetical protein